MKNFIKQLNELKAQRNECKKMEADLFKGLTETFPDYCFGFHSDVPYRAGVPHPENAFRISFWLYEMGYPSNPPKIDPVHIDFEEGCIKPPCATERSLTPKEEEIYQYLLNMT